jgi:hypothetical protein
MEELFLTLKTTNMKIFVVIYITHGSALGLIKFCENAVND